MKKYLEQRVEDLESEVTLLRTKIKMFETNKKEQFAPISDDYMYNPSVTLMSEPDLETAFASPFDKSSLYKTPLASTTAPTHLKTQPYYIATDSSSLPSLDSDFPPYPDIWGSWDNKNPIDIIK